VNWNWIAERCVTCRKHQGNTTRSTKNSRSDLAAPTPLPFRLHSQQAQYDKIKRKALLAPNATGLDAALAFGGNMNHVIERQAHEDQRGGGRAGGGFSNDAVNIGAVVGGMEANGVRCNDTRNSPRLIARGSQIQRTPIVNRTLGPSFVPKQGSSWLQQPQHAPAQAHTRNQSRHQLVGGVSDRSFRASSASDRSDSANEVENMLMNSRQPSRRTSHQGGWTVPAPGQRPRAVQQRGKR
jgi:hypothetical protein